MGTNYYTSTYCDACKRQDRDYHIGKSSYGWSFLFRGYRPEGLVSWDAWKEFLKDKTIMNEYNEQIDYDWFVHFIEGEKSPRYVRENGHKNLQHNDEMKVSSLPAWPTSELNWNDEKGYAFMSVEFS